MKITNIAAEAEVETASSCTMSTKISLGDRLQSIKQDWPRLYCLIARVVIPLLFLICMALLFGHIIAWIEAGGEREANDASLAFTYRAYLKRVATTDAMTMSLSGVSAYCYDQYFGMHNSSTTNSDNETDLSLREHLVECGTRLANENIPVVDLDDFFHDSGVLEEAVKFSPHTKASAANVPKLTFLWNSCGGPGSEGGDAFERNWYKYAYKIKDEWVASYQTLYDQNIDNGMDEEGAIEQALNEAQGTDGCEINTAGGALFWFTLITTIGYGTAVPSTPSGRYLCYSFGFICILMFTVLISAAGDVLVEIFDDYALRHRRLSFFVKNKFGATLTWLVIFVGYMFLLTGVIQGYNNDRRGEAAPLEDAIWFSYITLTTVGFGDVTISNDTMAIWDILHLSPLMLLGFSVLRNFLLKLSELVMHYFPEDEYTLKQRLKDLRECREGLDKSGVEDCGDKRDESLTSKDDSYLSTTKEVKEHDIA